MGSSRKNLYNYESQDKSHNKNIARFEYLIHTHSHIHAKCLHGEKTYSDMLWYLTKLTGK